MIRGRSVSACVFASFALSACAPQSNDQLDGAGRGGIATTGQPGSATGAADPDARWPFWPAGMRIHPLTRVVRDSATEQPVIEARLELLDQDGHASKGTGHVRFDLYEIGPQDQQVFIEQWNIDLSDPAVNRQQFDDITRTYLFRLDLRGKPLPERNLLRAYVLSGNGQAFRDAAPLRVQR